MKKHVFSIPKVEVSPRCPKCGNILMAGKCPSYMCNADSETKDSELVRRVQNATVEEWRYTKSD
jgi:tRNA(Ile2) C34 agmatinyltransferase TiaS